MSRSNTTYARKPFDELRRSRMQSLPFPVSNHAFPDRGPSATGQRASGRHDLANRSSEGGQERVAEEGHRFSQSPYGHGDYKQARVLDDEQLQRVIAYIWANNNSPFSDEVKILLSFKAGLRAAEISSLMMQDVCDADGRIAKSVIVRACNAKGKRARSIPMHRDLKEALQRLQAAHPNVPFIAFSNRRGHVKHQKISAITNWFCRLYKDVGLVGCSSHSGRRTFITNLARSANRTNHSLRDVQMLAGHARLDSTERYIDLSEDLTSLIGSL